MIDGLQPNPEYKESGQAWLGTVPGHWRVLPNRALFTEIKERDKPDEEMLSVTITCGIVRQKALLANSSKKDSSNQDKSAYKLVQPRDLAYNKMRAWQGAIAVSDLRGIFIQEGKKIIISTVQKFPFILSEIEREEKSKTFAIIIDEAHSSQGGKTSAAMSEALADPEDTVNDALERRMQTRKMLNNASYFAFTATPKNKTLEMFGEPLLPDEGKAKHRPFHSYTMKQAIQEGFVLDVLKSYTRVNSYYKLVKKIEGDPEFDTKRAKKKLRKYVESHDHAIRLKADIMVDHFHEQVMALNKIGGKARAMLVCKGIERLSNISTRLRRISKSARVLTRPLSRSPASTSSAGRKSPSHR